MHLFINKNGHILDLIDYKKFVPKSGIESCNGKEVVFSDGSRQEFDVVIVSTGYKPAFPFLPEQYTQKSFRDRYKHIFDNDDPSLAFVGFVRPVIGSMPGVAETQARWVAKIYSGRLKLKPKAERLEETKADAEYWWKYFETSSQRLDRIVEGLTYATDIARLANIYPDFTRLFKRNIYHWYVAMVSPTNTAFLRLNEPKHEDQAIATLQRHRQGSISPLHLLLILSLRLIWFDWWCVQLENLKYKIQTSKHWPTIRELRIVRSINWVWCLPKRMLFDNTTVLPDV